MHRRMLRDRDATPGRRGGDALCGLRLALLLEGREGQILVLVLPPDDLQATRCHCCWQRVVFVLLKQSLQLRAIQIEHLLDACVGWVGICWACVDGTAQATLDRNRLGHERNAPAANAEGHPKSKLLLQRLRDASRPGWHIELLVLTEAVERNNGNAMLDRFPDEA